MWHLMEVNSDKTLCGKSIKNMEILPTDWITFVECKRCRLKLEKMMGAVGE